ncbi:MAG: hypothetical protein N2B06_16910 [Clostridium sp.]
MKFMCITESGARTRYNWNDSLNVWNIYYQDDRGSEIIHYYSNSSCQLNNTTRMPMLIMDSEGNDVTKEINKYIMGDVFFERKEYYFCYSDESETE